jgi:hypothetical protein
VSGAAGSPIELSVSSKRGIDISELLTYPNLGWKLLPYCNALALGCSRWKVRLHSST